MSSVVPTARPITGSWGAMGTTAAIALVDGDQAWLVEARAAIDDLEQRWSRFRPESELSRINEGAGRAVATTPLTARLVHDAVSWWRATSGRFDPTSLAAVRDAGYVRSWDRGTGPIGDGQPVPGCEGIEVDLDISTVRVPVGVGLDLGGIGKGAAVDHIVGELAPGVGGGLVDLGGDLRVWGRAPEGDGWPIAVEDLRTGARAALLWLAAGAVATSSRLRRQWSDGRRHAHHIIDPATGRPVTGDLVQVTVVAGEAMGAEVLAKAALVAGTVDDALALLGPHAVAGLLFPAHGAPVAIGDLDDLRHPAEVA